jgi:HSP90 family molecular chaperone
MRLGLVLRILFVAFVAFGVVCEETANKGSAVTFQAEVAKILDILINSLYTDHKIFLREIISNASDALDKIRFLYLTNPKDPKNDAGESPTMDIRIRIDREKRQFVMRDGGVGMTKEELGGNLGSLGSSGTKRFLEKMKDSQDSNLIGQFGVGFYSVFLVSKKVIVCSKSDESDKQWCWESTGSGTYYIYEDTRGNTLGRGTELSLELKDDADEYLELEKIKEIIHRYSEFIHFPIYVQTTKVERIPKKKEGGEEEAPKSEEGEVKDEGEKKEEYEDVTKQTWELVNENKPIWTRKHSDVAEEDYSKFYKALTKDYEDPMYYTHFSAEGEVEFKSILFIPGRAPYNVFDTSIHQNNIRLYVRRVFITDEFKDLLPRYLNFIKGVVDSDDLPLHVSREVLQESRILKIIKKKLVRKALQMLADIAESDKKLEKEKDKKEDEKKEDAEDKKDDKKDADDDQPASKKLKEVTYPKFWEEFGKNLRLGMIEDGTNRARLTKLLRYKSSKSEDKLISFEDYVERMPESQKAIYFLTGESIEKIKQQPFLEDAMKRNVEVFYMIDAIDEYVVGHVTDFSGKKLVNLAKEGAKFGDQSKREKAVDAKRKEKYEPLTKWFKDLLGDKVTKIIISKRTTSEPLILSSPQHGVSANMARIIKGQTLGEKNQEGDAKRVLEVNHLHPLINEIFKRIKVDEKDSVASDLALILYDVASLQGGFDVSDSLQLGRRVGRMLRQSVDIAADAPLVEEDVNEYEVDDSAEDAAEGADDKKDDAPKDDDKKEDL